MSFSQLIHSPLFWTNSLIGLAAVFLFGCAWFVTEAQTETLRRHYRNAVITSAAPYSGWLVVLTAVTCSVALQIVVDIDTVMMSVATMACLGGREVLQRVCKKRLADVS